MLIRIYPENPNPRNIRQVVDVLESGGIVIYPTDTVYAMGCDITANRSIEKRARMKGFDPRKPDLSRIFSDMSMLSEYTIIRKTIFKLLKRNLRSFTFIVRRTTRFPKCSNKKRAWASGYPITG